jgi:membrane protein involved in colicin uptake
MSSGAPSESTPADQRIDRLSPEALVESFSRSHLLRWFLVALAAHLLLIGCFSIGTIRDMLDPEGAAARKAEALAATKAASAPAAAAEPPAAEAKTETTAAQSAAAPAAATEAAPQTAIERATSEVAKPDEIPTAPDDLGIGIDDTNPQ